MIEYRYTIDGDKIPVGMEYNQDGDLIKMNHNHPIRQYATHVIIDEDNEVLYIFAKNTEGFPPGKWMKFCEDTKKGFEKILPDVKIIVGAYDLKFTTIGRKQVFKGKLDGQIQS